MKKYFKFAVSVAIVWLIVMVLLWLYTVSVWLAGLGAAIVWVFVIDRRDPKLELSKVDVGFLSREEGIEINKLISTSVGFTPEGRLREVSGVPSSPKGSVPTPPCLPTDSSPCPFCGAKGLTGGAWTCCERMAERLWKDK